MQHALERRRTERAALLAEARGALPTLRRALGPVTVVVHGSVARGDFNRWSDIDLLIVAPALARGPLPRLARLLELCPPGVEPRGYTAAEFLHLRAMGDAQLARLLAEGVTLADDLHLLAPGA